MIAPTKVVQLVTTSSLGVADEAFFVSFESVVNELALEFVDRHEQHPVVMQSWSSSDLGLTVRVVDDYLAQIRYLQVCSDDPATLHKASKVVQKHLYIRQPDDLVSDATKNSSDTAALVRVAIATAERPNRLVADLLTQALQSTENRVRKAAAHAMGLTGWPQFVPALANAYDGETEGEERSFLRQCLIICGSPPTPKRYVRRLSTIDSPESHRRPTLDALQRAAEQLHTDLGMFLRLAHDNDEGEYTETTWMDDFSDVAIDLVDDFMVHVRYARVSSEDSQQVTKVAEILSSQELFVRMEEALTTAADRPDDIPSLMRAVFSAGTEFDVRVYRLIESALSRSNVDYRSAAAYACAHLKWPPFVALLRQAQKVESSEESAQMLASALEIIESSPDT